MRKFTLPLQKVFYVFLLLCCVHPGKSQAPLKLTDFAVWGGSASPNTYNSSQGVTVGFGATIQGNLGSNHLINIKNNFSLTGSIYSGNVITLGGNEKITGDIFAAKSATNSPANVISGDNRSNFIGNLTANGKIILQAGIGPLASTISGRVAVPAPSATNYSGPAPAGGIINTVVLPVLPSMPGNISFDSQVGTTNITSTQTISPGSYRKLALTGSKTLTFSGPGDYIFDEVDNGTSANQFVFDFKNTAAGTINIFIVKDAKWGKLSVNTVNGYFPSRIYTEIHGNGSTNGGVAFDLQGPGILPSGAYSWLGNVWAPNGGIAVKSFILSTSPQIVGALWSGTKVDLTDNLVLSYQVPPAPPPPPTFKLEDFAVWGGSASSGSYNSAQGVTIGAGVTIQGSIGSNHLIDTKLNLTLTGNIFSDNAISLGANGKIVGDIFAARKASNSPANAITGGYSNSFIGNLTANGKITINTGISLLASTISGRVAVPAPSSTNYSGPTPSGGIVNVVTLPVSPSMPNNTQFDNQAGTTDITGTQTISPGKYRKLALTGSKTLTFNGPGNYIFNEVNNGTSSNKLVFDFKNTATGTINIFIIKDAIWGKLSVNTINGNFPSRIYTEIHGNGSSNSGFTFNLDSPGALSSGNYSWLGNVWSPNGGIAVKGFILSTAPQIIGALWSGTKVDLSNNLVLSYQAPAGGPSYVDPYYPPPANGKVATANNVIGAELLSLSQNTAPITSIPDNEIFLLDNTGKVMIEVVSKTPNDTIILKGQLIALGMTNAAGVAGTIDNGPHIYTISGYFPVNKLTQLNANTRISYVRPLYPPISNTGLVTTQGDITMRSNNVRGRFGLDGSGVKIGVISDSYNSKLGAQTDINNGELPGIKSNGQLNDNPVPVQLVDSLLTLTAKGNDEGRAMLQIVHDIAPKSKLAFRTGFLTAGDFAKGIQQMASPSLPGGRCDVIVDDITYVTEPFLRDGIVAQAVNQVVAQGVTYFSSAGNFGNKSYEAVFNGVTNTAIIPTGQIHKFGSTAADIYQTINLKPGSYTIVLQWSDEFHSLGSVAGVQTDMDLYLLDANGFSLFGFNRSNLLGDPFEVCPFTVKKETNAKLMVVRADTGTSNVRFKYIVFRGDATILDYQTGTSSLVGQANADSAIAVGAMLYANIPPFTPVWPGVASFSSRGGTFTLKTNTTTFASRKKPELIGPNGVNTTVDLGGAAFDDGDPYPNFFGTSAAAPHVAAVAALLIQGRKKFNQQLNQPLIIVKPYEIRQQLQTSAGKFTNADSIFSVGGYGYVQADSAIQQIANAKPIIDSMKAVVPGAQNGNQPFVVKMKGKYLTSNTKIYVNGIAISNTTVSADKTEATATVPAIPSGQNPPFQLFNPAKSPSNLDGGLSDSMYFFGSRIKVIVKAENKAHKYGLENPPFTATVSLIINGDTLRLNQTNITLAALKLDNLTFTNFATPASTPGSYAIFVSRTTPLANNDTLLSRYVFTFDPGTLTVQKMPLKITPDTLQIKYGEYPGNITYKYKLDTSAANSSAILDEVKALHKKYLADNGLIVINGLNDPNVGITPSDFVNMSTMASFQSVRNARKFVLQNGQLQAVVNNINPSQIGDQRFIVDVSAQSLVNYKSDPANSTMVQSLPGSHARGLLNIKALTNGTAKAAVPNGQLQPMVNGQLLAMVNGQLQAMVNGQLQAMVNGIWVTAEDIVFQNGQLLAMVNGTWTVVTNGQLIAVVNGQAVTVELSVTNGQLQAVVNGQLMPMVNGQLQAVVNGQLLAVVNGQLQAVVNGQLMPMVNGQLMAVVNGQLMPMVNGQLQAVVNGQLMAVVNGELQVVQDITLLSNGQLQAVVNGLPQAVVNGQLKAMVNGIITDIPTTGFSLVNGQLQAVVNGQLLAMVNGQLLAVVNGQLQPMVNSLDVNGANNNTKTVVLVDADDINLQSGNIGGMFSMNMITGLDAGIQTLIPGGFVNENFEVTYGLGQVEILKTPLTIKAKDTTKVYGDANPAFTISYSGFAYNEGVGNITAPTVSCAANNSSPVNTYPITLSGGSSANYTLVLQNGNLNITKRNLTVTANSLTKVYGDANLPLGYNAVGFVNGDDILDIDVPPFISTSVSNVSGAGTYPINLIGGSDNNYNLVPQPGVFTVTKATLFAAADNKTKVYGEANPALSFSYGGFLLDDDASDVAIVPIIATIANTGSSAGNYPITLSGGAANNYNFSYTQGILTITPAPLTATADDKSKVYGAANPVFTISYSGFVNGNNASAVTTPPVAATTATANSGVGVYPITLTGGSSANYFIASYVPGTLTIGKKTLNVTADNKTKVTGNPTPSLTISYNGLIGDDTPDSVCIPYVVPSSPKIIDEVERRMTYTDVKINNSSNVFYASPGQLLTLTGNWFEQRILPYNVGCTGCITQLRIGMANESGGNVFASCDDVSGLGDHSGAISNTFNAPSAPGVYYITQISTWWYTCPAPNYGDPPQIPIHNNGPNAAIAVVVVNVSNTNITASTTADITSPAGSYPITLQGCNNYNPNYNVVLQNGTLTVQDHCIDATGHVWKADGNYNDDSGSGNGTPFGGVTATGEAKVGSNSFSFDGSTGYISTGTNGSVSGTDYFSVSAWIKTTSNGPMMIINQRDANNDGEYILKVGGIHSYPFSPGGAVPGKAYFLIYGSGSNIVDLISTISVNDGNWHFIKGERDGAAVRLYVDGVLEASGNTGVAVNLNGSITTTIGKDLRDNNAYFNGLIDDIRVVICTPGGVPTSRNAPVTSQNSSEAADSYIKPAQDKLYPNPAETMLRLQLRDDVASVKDILVYDEIGNRSLVSARKVGDGFYEINVSGLSRGIYIIQARTGAGIKIFKFIKM